MSMWVESLVGDDSNVSNACWLASPKVLKYPSSNKHGSFKNGPCNSSYLIYLSNIAIFHFHDYGRKGSCLIKRWWCWWLKLAHFFFRPWWLPAGKPLVEDFMKKLRDHNKNKDRDRMPWSLVIRGYVPYLVGVYTSKNLSIFISKKPLVPQLSNCKWAIFSRKSWQIASSRGCLESRCSSPPSNAQCSPPPRAARADWGPMMKKNDASNRASYFSLGYAFWTGKKGCRNRRLLFGLAHEVILLFCHFPQRQKGK